MSENRELIVNEITGMSGMTEMKEMTRDDWEDLCVSGRSTAQEF